MDEYGHSDMSPHLIRKDELLKQFYEAREWHKDHPLCQSTLKDLLAN